MRFGECDYTTYAMETHVLPLERVSNSGVMSCPEFNVAVFQVVLLIDMTVKVLSV